MIVHHSAQVLIYTLEYKTRFRFFPILYSFAKQHIFNIISLTIEEISCKKYVIVLTIKMFKR